MTIKRTFKGSEVLPENLIRLVQDALDDSIPDFRGGHVYIPSRVFGDVRSKASGERAYLRSLAIIAAHDGFTSQEAATMVGVSIPTVHNWIRRFGEPVREALNVVRGEQDD